MYEKIPDELKRCPQWVCWQSEPDPKMICYNKT